MNKLHIIIGIVISLFLLFPIGNCTITITTLNATNYTTNYVILNGNLTGLTEPFAIVYFEYGALPGIYIYGTTEQNLTSNGVFNQTLEGIQLIPDQTYYFRTVGNENASSTLVYGSEKSFPLDPLTTIPTPDFSKHYEELEEAKFNLTKLVVVIPKTYTDLIEGTRENALALFTGVLFALIFIGIWIRQEDVGIPAILGMLLGGVLWALLPEEFTKIAYSLLIVSLGSLIYTLIKGRK